MFHSFSAKIFFMLATLITLLDITSTTLCCKTVRSKIRQIFIQVLFKYFSFSSIFYTKKLSFLAAAICKIFVIEKQQAIVVKNC